MGSIFPLARASCTLSRISSEALRRSESKIWRLAAGVVGSRRLSRLSCQVGKLSASPLPKPSPSSSSNKLSSSRLSAKAEKASSADDDDGDEDAVSPLTVGVDCRVVVGLL